MSEYKNTPGPWRVANRDFPRAGMAVLKDLDGRKAVLICTIPGNSEGSVIEDVANADLIAAAPDLLEACRAFVHWYSEDSSEFNRDEAFEKARAAITKAAPGR